MVSCGGFFLLLIGLVVGVLLALLPRTTLRALLYGLRRALPFVALFLIAVAAALLFRLLLEGRSPPAAWVFQFFLLCGVVALFIWILRGVIHPTPPPAAAPLRCPPVRLLKDMLGERLSSLEQARVAAHLEACTACQHRVEGLTAAQGAWTGLAGKLSHRPPAPEPALRKVMDNLKAENTPEETRDEPVFCADLPLDFLSPPDKPGQLGRLERYEVLEEVGRGGMGVVLKAFDPSLHRVVAIKVLAPQLATSGVARRRFLREAKAAAAVTHDHIVTIHAVDEAGGLPYLVMQYIAGLSLQERIDKDGPLAEMAEIVRVGMQTASALAAAHSHGIVHRDIKPANILLEEGVQRVKITDFGLARAMDDASLTQSGFVAGSPLYMAPEQARGEALDHRADLFSLGSVLYTACTGRPPFRAANTLAVFRRVCEDPPRPIRQSNPEVPDWFVAIVEKLMAKDAADRFQSAAEVVEALGQHVGALVPLPPVPKAEPGLPTSVTICAACGATLHVPESMVGKTVHCEECGKSFVVEEGSEEIVVARAMPSPFGKRAAVAKKAPTWPLPVGLVVVLLAFLAFLLLLVGLSVSSAQRRTPAMSAPPAPPPGPGGTRQVGPPFWQSSLGWFPAEATLFGAVDLKAFGPLTLDDEGPQAMLRLALPAPTAKKLTSENLGRVKIEGMSLAYYDGRGKEPARAFLQVEGLALDGRRRLIDFLRDEAGGALQVDEADVVRRAGKPIRVTSPELPFALGVFDDHRLFLARALSKDSKGPDHLKALEHVSSFDFANRVRGTGDILSGYNPPWLKAALGEMPREACALFVGEVPREWRKALTEKLELRACPRTFVCSMKREGGEIVLSLTLNLEKAGAELILQEDLEKWRLQGLAAVQEKLPALRKEAEALALLGHALRTMRWGAKPGSGSVGTYVRFSDPTWQALGKLIKRASLSPEEEEAP